MENDKLFKIVKTKLYKLFNKQCPPPSKSQVLTSNKDEMVNLIKSWYDFWESQYPEPKVFQNDKILQMKKLICEQKFIAIHDLLVNLELLDYFKQKFDSKY